MTKHVVLSRDERLESLISIEDAVAMVGSWGVKCQLCPDTY